MNITHDEPGRLLTLEGEDPRLGGAIGGLVGGLLAASGNSEELWHPSRISVNREAGSFEVVDTNVVSGEKRREVIPLSHIGKLNVQPKFWRPPTLRKQTPGPPGSDGVELTLSIDDATPPRTRSLWMRIDGLDSIAKVADFAYRLGAAMGLSYQRVVHSDPRRIEIEMTARQESGTSPLPRIDDRANYAQNGVLPAAADAASREVVAPFEPARFQGNYKVPVWAPGNEVRFVKPFEKAGWGCLPVVIVGLLLGPGAYLLKPDQVTFTVIASILGLVAALFGGKVVASCLPRHTVISWRDRTIRTGGGLSRRQIPFDQLAALELRCVRTFYDSTTYRSYTTFQCSLLAHLQGDATPVGIVSTNEFESDPDTPYELALPLVTELARALNVERRVTDYN